MNKDTLFQTNFFIPKNGEKIGKDLGISRQRVSQILKKAVVKVFKKIKNQYKLSDFDTMLMITEMFNLSDDDACDFLKLFSKDIQKAVKLDAEKKLYIKS